MTDIVYDYITMGVDMIISGVILTAIVVLLKTVTILNNYSAQQQAVADRITYYKQFNMYDNTANLSSADVVSALIYYKGQIDIRVKFDCNDPRVSGTSVLYYDNTTDKFILDVVSGEDKSSSSASEMKEWIKSTSKFNAILYEDMADASNPSSHYKGGVITGITFTTSDSSF